MFKYYEWSQNATKHYCKASLEELVSACCWLEWHEDTKQRNPDIHVHVTQGMIQVANDHWNIYMSACMPGTSTSSVLILTYKIIWSCFSTPTRIPIFTLHVTDDWIQVSHTICATHTPTALPHLQSEELSHSNQPAATKCKMIWPWFQNPGVFPRKLD